MWNLNCEFEFRNESCEWVYRARLSTTLCASVAGGQVEGSQQQRDDRQGCQAQSTEYCNRLRNDSALGATGAASERWRVRRRCPHGNDGRFLKPRSRRLAAAASSPGDFSRRDLCTRKSSFFLKLRRGCCCCRH